MSVCSGKAMLVGVSCLKSNFLRVVCGMVTNGPRQDQLRYRESRGHLSVGLSTISTKGSDHCELTLVCARCQYKRVAPGS